MTAAEVERHLQSRHTLMEMVPERAPPTVPTEMFSNEPSLDSCDVGVGGHDDASSGGGGGGGRLLMMAAAANSSPSDDTTQSLALDGGGGCGALQRNDDTIVMDF